jgi:hypothetical protein
MRSGQSRVSGQIERYARRPRKNQRWALPGELRRCLDGFAAVSST